MRPRRPTSKAGSHPCLQTLLTFLSYASLLDLQPCPAGLKHDPSNQQLKEGLEQAKSSGNKGNGLFGPQFLAKLAMDPSTRGYLSQPDFMQMLQNAAEEPADDVQLHAGPALLPCPVGEPSAPDPGCTCVACLR